MRTDITVRFLVEHGEEGCGEPWDTASISTATLALLAERFENDGLRVVAVAARNEASA